MVRQFTRSMVVLASLFLAQQSVALTPDQKKELFEKGTISVFKDNKKVGHFEVRFLPGASNVTADAKKAWLKAEDLMDDFLDAQDFWHDTFLGSFKTGIRYMKKNYDNGVAKIPDDFRTTRAENSELNGTFGSSIAKLKNWLEFTATVGGRVIRSLWGVGAGALYSIVTPTALVVYRPIAAGTEALVAGTLWPVAKYTWNAGGFLWVRNDKAPQIGENSLTVTYIPEIIGDQDLEDEDLSDDDSDASAEDAAPAVATA